MTQVNRYLKDKGMDRIDHALGRPVDPITGGYRNYFCANEGEDDLFPAPHWQETNRAYDMVYYAVTRAGRVALARHLKDIGDKTRLYQITFYGEEMSPVAAKSHSQAKYKKWLEWDTSDLTFAEFLKGARVRLSTP